MNKHFKITTIIIVLAIIRTEEKTILNSNTLNEITKNHTYTINITEIIEKIYHHQPQL